MIAARLGRVPSTVTRDVAAGGGRARYRAWRVDATAHRRARRPKSAKLVACPRLRAEVERGLNRRWSPQQIAARLVRDFPDDPEMRVSHETIDQSLNRSSCKGAEPFAGSSPRSSRAASARGGRSVAPAAACRAPASSKAWC